MKYSNAAGERRVQGRHASDNSTTD